MCFLNFRSSQLLSFLPFLPSSLFHSRQGIHPSRRDSSNSRSESSLPETVIHLPFVHLPLVSLPLVPHPPISDLRPPSSDLRPPTSVHRPLTSLLRSPTSVHRPLSSDLRLLSCGLLLRCDEFLQYFSGPPVLGIQKQGVS